METRIRFSRFLLRLGDFIQTLPVVIMKPDDLLAFSRQTYLQAENILAFSEESFVHQGLSSDEIELLEKIPEKSGKILILGVGGGREVIPFGKMGYQITGVDFIPELVRFAKKNAELNDIEFEGLVQDISKLDISSNNFDLVWLSKGMYSSIPSRSRRIDMAKRIFQTLKPGGYFICQFHFQKDQPDNKISETVRRIIAKSPFGNRFYEKGDNLWAKGEFIHFFTSLSAVSKELIQSGFQINYHNPELSTTRGGVVCQKIID